jgi:hypothetical protein
MNADPAIRLMERLPRAAPDPARAARTRARCHAALGRQRAVRRTARQVRARAWESALVAGVCAAYLTEVVRSALHLYGVL